MWGSLIILLLTFVLLPRYYLVTHTLQQKLSSVLNKHNIIQDITKKCCESVYIMWIFWSKLHTSFIIIQGEVELCLDHVTFFSQIITMTKNWKSTCPMNNTFFFHNVKKMFCHDRIHTNSVSAMQLPPSSCWR